MCSFEYHSYDACGHKCIELITYCVNRLWMAGMHGRLWACPELKYSRHLKELIPLTWEGMYGYCKQCQHEYAMPETTSYRSLNDVHSPAKMPEPALRFQAPLISTPRVSQIVAKLLGIESQIQALGLWEGHPLIFQAKFATYDYSEAGHSSQWLSHGFYDGKQAGPIVSAFSNRSGMTNRDCAAVAVAIKQHMVLDIWRRVFEGRGMDWQYFLRKARIIGTEIGENRLDSDMWENLVFGCFVQTREVYMHR